MEAKGKLDALWEQITSSEPPPTPAYPGAKSLLAFAKALDYDGLLQYEEDVQPPGRAKVVCSAGGATATVRFSWKPQAAAHFTGMFRRADHGLLRCSSASQPQVPSKWLSGPAMILMVGLKFFRDGGAPSGNVLLAHKKSGWSETNFFAHAVSNHFTENIKFPFNNVLQVFKKYSDFPTFSGLAEFASLGQDGVAETKPVAPFALVLRPPASLRARPGSPAPSLAQQMTGLGAGDVLYEAFAVPEPLDTSSASRIGAVCEAAVLEECPTSLGIWRVGELVLTSGFVGSTFADQQLFFRHAVFDKDLSLRPDWRLKVDTMLGAPFYEDVVAAGHVWDPSTPTGSRAPSKEEAVRQANYYAACRMRAVISDSEEQDALAETASSRPDIAQAIAEAADQTTCQCPFLAAQARSGTPATPAPASEQSEGRPRRASGVGGLFAGLLSQCLAPLCSACGGVQDELRRRGPERDEARLTLQLSSASQASAEGASPGRGPVVATVTIFTVAGCPHCQRVRSLLDDLGWEYWEISLTDFPERRLDLLQLCNRLTVPQVFFNSRHIGGAREFSELLASAKDPSALLRGRTAAATSDDPRLRQPAHAGEASAKQASAPSPELLERVVCVGAKCVNYWDLQTALLSGVAVKDQRRRFGLATHKQCFKGRVCADFLTKYYQLPGRLDAVQVGNQLLRSGLFSLVDGFSEHFEDDGSLYRFQCHEGGLWKALNVERIGTPPNVADPLAVLARLTGMLDVVLAAHTDRRGVVDHVAAAGDGRFTDFCRGACELQSVDLAALEPRLRAAFVINLYNMAVRHAYTALGAPSTTGQRLAFFNGVRYQLAGLHFSLNDLENGVLRGNRRPPYHLRRPFDAKDARLKAALQADCRVHFALNCGAGSCPAVGWFTSAGLDEELALAARAWAEQPENVRVDVASRTLWLSKICKWYEVDFGEGKFEVARAILPHTRGPLHAGLTSLLRDKFALKHLPYDWSNEFVRAGGFEGSGYKCLAVQHAGAAADGPR